MATWGTNPGCPGAGYTFRTIDAAAACARGKDTIYVHGGTYGHVLIINLWPSTRGLITNAPGENPVIEGWSSIADYQAILGLWQVSNIAIQGLTIQNTGVPDAEHGGYSIRVSSSSSVKLYFNTVHDTARHGIITDGSQMEVVGNEIYNTVMRNRWWQSSYWDAAVSSDPNRSQWGYKVIGNSIHDSWGERRRPRGGWSHGRGKRDLQLRERESLRLRLAERHHQPELGLRQHRPVRPA